MKVHTPISALFFCILLFTSCTPLESEPVVRVREIGDRVVNGPDAQICFIYIDEGGQKFYFDEGDIYAGEKLLGTTTSGCILVPQNECVGKSSLTFHPQTTKKFGYTMTTNEMIDTCRDAQVSIPKQGFEEFARLGWAIPYIENVLTDDPRFAHLGKEIAYGCLDASCKVNYVYRDVVETLKYIPDPSIGDQDTIIPPDKTLARGGGDCEDLTGVMNTYLENLDVDTKIVLTEKHAYSLACGIDKQKLQQYVKDGFYQEQTFPAEQEYILEPNQVVFYGGTTVAAQRNVDYSFTVESSERVDVYVVENQNEYVKFTQNKGFSHFPDCSRKNVARLSRNCHVPDSSGIMIANLGDEVAVVNLNVEYTYSDYIVDLDDIKLNFYDLNGESCVVLDGTAGKYGYPGYSVDEYDIQIAVDPETYEWWYLE